MVEKLNRSSCLVKFCWFGIIAQAGRVEFTAAKSEGIKSIILVSCLVLMVSFWTFDSQNTVPIGCVKFDFKTLGISPKDLEGFKADIGFIYTTLARWLAISTILNFDLTFITRSFIGSCVIRCAFWLVSRKDDWIKKLTNKISLHLSNLFWEMVYKSNRTLFSCVCIAWYKHSRGWENYRQLCKPSTSSRVCRTVWNSPNPSRVYIRLCKHRKRFLLLKWLDIQVFSDKDY